MKRPKLYLNCTVRWAMVFGIAWASGKEFGLPHNLVSVFFGPFTWCVCRTDFNDNEAWNAAFTNFINNRVK